MKRIIFAMLLLSVGLCASAAQARDPVIEGVISAYDCGDNCYLTITDASGRAHGALCTAPLCRTWNEKAEMPTRFKGRKVRATVGTAPQYDGAGHVMGKMEAFKKIDLLK